MSITQMQVVKYAFPTIALIIGIWWYKRRRMDRVDPGGIKERDLKDNNRTNVKSENANLLISQKNLSDSGIHTDDSLSLNSSSQPVSEFVCSPRRVSENLDIPSRKPSSSIPISIRSSRSSNDSQSWYKDVDLTLPDTKEVQLGSNPKISSFDTIVKMRGVQPPFETVQENMDVKENEKLENPVEGHENENAVSNSQSCEIKEQNPENHSCVESREQPSACNNSENDNKVVVQLSERDSANHSPISGVLDGSVTDEARSEGSTDSGKGGSINGHAKDNVNNSEILLYEFFVPLHVVGRMIGRNGSGLQAIRVKAGVSISIKRHSSTKDLNTCIIQGSSQGINTALEMIRKKFPEKRHPDLTLEQIALSVLPEEIPWAPEFMCLSLVEGVNNDVVICHIYKPNRLFVQLPTHPTYPALRLLDTTMTQLYDTTESPAVPDELQKGMIVVAKWYEKWVRVFVECPDPNGERNLVRLVDHGGYWTFSNSEMRKIRSDFLTLPFQAIEVFLANVKPKNGEWEDEAYNMIAYVCTGVVVQAQIEGYINSNVYVNLYINIQKHGVISMADELVARGFAEPITLEETTPEEELSLT